MKMKAAKDYICPSAPVLIMMLLMLLKSTECPPLHPILSCLELDRNYTIDLKSKETPLYKETMSYLERKIEASGYQMHFFPNFSKNHDGRALAEVKVNIPPWKELLEIEEDFKKEGLIVLSWNSCKCEGCPWSEGSSCPYEDHPGGQCLCMHKQCDLKCRLLTKVKKCVTKGNTSTTHKTEKSLTTLPTSTEKSLTAPPTSNCDRDNSITHKNFSKTENSSITPITDTSNTDQNYTGQVVNAVIITLIVLIVSAFILKNKPWQLFKGADNIPLSLEVVDKD